MKKCSLQNVLFGAVALVAAPLCAQEIKASEEYPEFYNGDTTKGIDFIQSIRVLAPAHCSFIQGDTTVIFRAPGMKQIKAFCWQQPTAEKPGEWGHDELLADITLTDRDRASFVFKADQFPNGPLTIRIQAKDDKNKQDYCELQVFNLGGVVWNQGIPKTDPPGAKGMQLAFADDFDGPLSISPNGTGARYAAHKPGGGDFSGWPFTDPAGDDEPFGQEGTFLRIHATKASGSGILASVRPDGSGVCVPVPSYFECRFVAQSAPGTWPAFWTLTKGTLGMSPHDPDFERIKKMGSDELDIIEAYGGYGPKNPNSGGRYHSVTHFWGQPKQPWQDKSHPNHKPSSFVTDILALGGKSSWSWTFHTYGLAITETDTVYYFDDIEIGRHPTGPTSLAQPAYFLINYAIGGISGWQIDMQRYGNQTDMWVDFVRVYCGAAQPPEISVNGFVGKNPATVTMATITQGADIRYTTDGSEPTASSTRYTAPVPVANACTIKAAAFAKGLKPSPVAKAVIATPPGLPGSIGVNFFGEDTPAQRLAANETAGLAPAAQACWNAVSGTPGTTAKLLFNDGSPANGLTMTIAGDAKPGKGEPWGFNGPDLKLQLGATGPNPSITFTGVPHAKYDVLVFLTAGVNSSRGNVSLAKPVDAKGAVDAATYTYNHGWLGGKFATSATTDPGKEPTNANAIRFTGNTADAFTVTLKSTSHWTGISAIQIIPVKY